jgi:hypothetical protein
MAKKGGLGGQFYIGGYDLSGDVSALDQISSPRGVQDLTGLSSSAIERLLTHGDGLMDFKSWFNDASLQSHPALSPLLTTDVLAFYAQSTTRGDVMAHLVSKQINYDGSRTQDGALSLTVQCLANLVPLEWGDLLTAGKVSHSSGASTTSVDNSASSASGAAVFLQVMSLASGTVTITVEDSANNSTWATLKAFTNATGRTTERLTVAGTVDRYLRVTTSGSFSTAVFAVGIRRGESVDDTAYA